MVSMAIAYHYQIVLLFLVTLAEANTKFFVKTFLITNINFQVMHYTHTTLCVCVRDTIAVMKYPDQTNLGRKGFI